MNKMTMRVLPALLLAAFSGAASAAAFQLWEQNASGLGTAYAGSAAVADNASTNFFNPAGLTQLGGFQFSAGVAAVGPSYEFRNENSAGAVGPGGNGGNAGGWAAGEPRSADGGHRGGVGHVQARFGQAARSVWGAD